MFLEKISRLFGTWESPEQEKLKTGPDDSV